MSKHSISSLPKWAQAHIAELNKRVEFAELTIPWAQPGTEWFTLFHPQVCKRAESINLFTCSKEGTQSVCSLGPNDFVFVGRKPL